MQAIMETLFDVVYLISVITIGILMIRCSRGNSQYRLFGFMAVVLGAGDAFHLIPRAVALCTTGLEHYTISLGLGKWITSVTMTIFYVLLYICVAAAIQGQGTERADRCGLSFGRPADHPVYDAAESVAQCRRAPFLGHLLQYTLCAAGPCGHRIVLSQRQGAWRPGFPMDVADHCAELWLLYSGGAVGGRCAHDRDADDPQNLCLCLDGPDRVFCHEAGVQIEKKRLEMLQ